MLFNIKQGGFCIQKPILGIKNLFFSYNKGDVFPFFPLTIVLFDICAVYPLYCTIFFLFKHSFFSFVLKQKKRNKRKIQGLHFLNYSGTSFR